MDATTGRRPWLAGRRAAVSCAPSAWPAGTGRRGYAVEPGAAFPRAPSSQAYRTELTSSFSVAWQRTPYAAAGWVTWPSQTGPEYRLLDEPAGRVCFAGDWLSHAIAWQHGAFTSARRAVTAVHQRVMAA